ncbi:Uncharacterised protein [Mycobacteroides abscessus subsp. abscessus]|nr:Uncharacterised protein [Mycobacteroides abscessus subsp. abscessus]
MACCTLRPPSVRNSSTSSNDEESDPPGVQIGNMRSMSPPKSALRNIGSRARIQFLFPTIVLISPL